jgi:hypothetical protein
MASCILCSSRRGTRPCPALRTEVCSICCGTKRRRTVACPEECTFLRQGRAYQERRVGDTEPLKRIRELDAEYVNALDQSILDIRETRFRDLLDREVKEALENVLKTVETGERGLIYEYRSPDPRVQILTDSIKRVIDEFRKERRVEAIETRSCLFAAIIAIKSMLRHNPDSTAYLDLITQYARDVASETDHPSGLIQLP